MTKMSPLPKAQVLTLGAISALAIAAAVHGLPETVHYDAKGYEVASTHYDRLPLCSEPITTRCRTWVRWNRPAEPLVMIGPDRQITFGTNLSAGEHSLALQYLHDFGVSDKEIAAGVAERGPSMAPLDFDQAEHQPASTDSPR